MSLMIIVGCKNQPVDSCLSGAVFQATSPEVSKYYGGFLRLRQADGSQVDCDAMLMADSESRFEEWSSITIHTSRSCLEMERGAQASFLLFLGSRDSAESQAEYVELPIASSYLEALGELRVQFADAYKNVSSVTSGITKLEKYERMISQIHRMKAIDYQSSYREHGWIGQKDELSEESHQLFLSLQADLCSFGVIDRAIVPPTSSARYQKLLKYRIHEEQQKKLGCYLFQDLMIFDAKVTLNQKERQSLKSFWPADVPSYSVARDLSNEEVAMMKQISTQQRLRAQRDVEFLAARISESTGDENLSAVSESEYDEFMTSSSGWARLDLSGKKASGGVVKAISNNIRRFVVGHMTRFGSPLEEGINDEIPSRKLMVAGNVMLDSPQKQLFHFYAQPMNTDRSMNPVFQSHTFIDKTLYGLLVAFRGFVEGQQHPVDTMHTGSLLLYGGQPIATLLVVNKGFVVRESSVALLHGYADYQVRASQNLKDSSSQPQTGSQTGESGQVDPTQPEADAITDTPKTPSTKGSSQGQVASPTVSPSDQKSPSSQATIPAITAVVNPTPIASSAPDGSGWFEANDVAGAKTDQPCEGASCDDGSVDDGAIVDAETQVCDPSDDGCADDGTYCSGDTTKPGCDSFSSVDPHKCVVGTTGCSNTGQYCSQSPHAPGCESLSADACGTSFFGLTAGCSTTALVPKDTTQEVVCE